MAETVVEKEACSKCGAEVREGTAFCYACGGRGKEKTPEKVSNGVPKGLDANAQAALDDLTEKLKGEEPPAPSEEKLAKAAEQRKKARVTQRKTRDFVWEPRNDMPLFFLIAVAVVAILAVLVVLVTVIWK